MRDIAVDSSFLIDLQRGHPDALIRAERFDASEEHGHISPPALSEFLVGAHHEGGARLESARGLARIFTLLDFDEIACEVIARTQAGLIAKGEQMSATAIMIGGLALRHRMPLLTRDGAFARIPGLHVETY